MNTNMPQFIAQRRKEMGLTQKQLAQQLNVTDKAVSKWERGAGHPDIGLLEPLAAALNVSVTELLTGPQETPEAAPAPVQDELIVKGTLQYASGLAETHRAKVSNIIMLILALAGATGILVTIIVDLAISHRLTWSLYPIVSILFAELIALPFFYFAGKRALMALLSTSVFLLPFLYAIAWLSGGGWFMPVGLPIGLCSLGFLWLVYLLFATGLSFWNKLSLALLGGALLNIAIDFILSRNGIQSFDIWNILDVLIFLFAALVLFCAGRVFKKKNTP